MHINVSAYTGMTNTIIYSKSIYYYICYFVDKKPAKKRRNALIFFGEKPPQCGEELV